MTHADAADAPRPGGDPTGGSGGSSPARRRGAEAERPGPGARLVRFLREVVAELRKVVRPTRRELLTYTSVVLVFVAVVMLYVSGLDYLLDRKSVV